MVERFFSVKQNERRNHRPNPILLLSGPPSCGKTSLLFQFAFNSALEGNVVFICNRLRLEKKPPSLSQGVDSTSDPLKRIRMKYVDSDEGIKKFFAAFHLLKTFPAAVIIDDFGDFFDERICQEKYGNPRGRDLAITRTLALCHNAINYARDTRSCELLLSDTHHGESSRMFFIYKRCVQSIFTIRESNNPGSFILRRNHGSCEARSAKYSNALQYLVLEGISEDICHRFTVMRAKQFLVSAIIGLYCFVHGSFGRQFVPQMEDLKAPEPVKSYTFPSGDIVDCIDIFKQPAFDHPLLKNHTLQRLPTKIPIDYDINASNDGVGLAGASSNEEGLCPPETVPIRRTERKYDDPNIYRFAYLKVIRDQNDMFYGAAARIRADNPKCEEGQTSGSSIWIGSDLSDQKNFIKAGWTVNPKVYGDNLSRISVYWTADGFHKTGCYDLQCPGFIQVEGTAVLGIPLNKVSAGDQIWETFFYIFQDQANQNWWLVLTDHHKDTFVGYWPSELFPRLRGGATIVHFGGSTSARPGQPFPPMGNGKFPANGYEGSNFLRFMKYVNKTNLVVPPKVAQMYSDNTKCYKLQYDDGSVGMGHGLYVGGPGGVC